MAVASTLFAVAMWPVLALSFISSVDYYNHVARMVVLADFHHLPAYSDYWVQAWSFLPVQAIDAIAFVLAPSLGQVWVGKAVIAVAFFLLLSGSLALHRSLHGRWSVWPAVAGVLLLNRLLLAGVLNTLVGFGLALHGLAVWNAMRASSTWQRLGLLLAAAWVVCLSHFVAFGFLGIAVAGMMLGRLIAARAGLSRWLACAGELAFAFLPPLIAAVLATPKTDASFAVRWHPLASRLGAFLVPLTYAPVTEALVLGLVACAVMLCAVRGRVSLHPAAGFAVLVLVLVQVMMPDYIATSGGADHRLPIAILLMLIAAFDLREVPALPMVVLIGCMLVAGTVKAVVVERVWSQDALVYAEVLGALRSLPDGVRIAATEPHIVNSDGRASSAVGLVDWWIVPRGGYVQTAYALPSQAPMVFRGEWLTVAQRTRGEAVWAILTKPASSYTAVDIAALDTLPRFDYVIAVCGEGCPVFVPLPFLDPVRVLPHIAIYAVKKASR